METKISLMQRWSNLADIQYSLELRGHIPLRQVKGDLERLLRTAQSVEEITEKIFGEQSLISRNSEIVTERHKKPNKACI